MKTFSIIFMLMVALTESPTVEEFTIEATYTGLVDGMYTFVDDDESTFEFSDIDLGASQKFNLDSDEFIGKKFTVTYDLETEIDENDEEYEVYIIIDLALID